MNRPEGELGSAAPSVRSLDRHLRRRRWSQARRDLLGLLHSQLLDHRDFDRWGEYAGAVERGFRASWRERENFWRHLAQTLERIEADTGERTHKGLVYFKLGAMGLLADRSFLTAIRWFERAYREDKRRWDDAPADADPPNPQAQSAYRVLAVLRAFDRFARDRRNADVRPIIQRSRARIGRFLAATYDHTVREPTILRAHGAAPFTRLLGRNAYRTLVEQNYRAAGWLCERQSDLESTNLEKYGVAQAVLVLCGATLEGILAANSGVRGRVRAKARSRKAGKRRHMKKYELKDLVKAYIEGVRGAPELTAGLVFLWFSRNLIHPNLARRHGTFVVDMAFADFAWTLTGGVVALMAQRARPRKT